MPAPAPILVSLSQNTFVPLTVFTFTLTGIGFTADAVVSSYDETLTTTTVLATTFISDTVLSVTTLITDLAAHYCDMSVTQISGTSNPVTMNGNGIAPPALTSMTPNVLADSVDTPVVLIGTGFSVGNVYVYPPWPSGTYAGAATAVTAIEIDQTIMGAIITPGGQYYVQETEGATGPYSNLLPFESWDLPVVTDIIPPSIFQGSPDITIEIDGTYFSPDTIAYADANELVTTYVSDIKLFAVIPSAMLVNAGVIELTVTADGGTSVDTQINVIRVLYAKSYATLTSFPAPKTKAECLPEGKRIVTLSIDFTQLQIYPESILFSELTLPIGNAIGNTGEPCGGYQTAQINLASLQNSIGLSEIRSIMYNWRPNYGVTPDGTETCDFAVPFDRVCPLFITNLQTMQTVTIGLNAGASMVTYESGVTPLDSILQGVKSFLGNNNTTIRFLLPVTDLTAGIGWGIGKGIFIFANFELPADNNSVSIFTGAN